MMNIIRTGCLCAVTLTLVACADEPGTPTSPSATAAFTDLGTTGGPSFSASSSPRFGDLRVTKECSKYTGAAGSFCTITSSNLAAIEVGSRIVYAQAAGAASLNSDIVLDTPGPGANAAFGHCALDSATGRGLCTFSGGRGKFTFFQASVNVSSLGNPNWGWEGTYSFSPRD